MEAIKNTWIRGGIGVSLFGWLWLEIGFVDERGDQSRTFEFSLG